MSLFCDSHDSINAAYSDLVESSKGTLDSLAELQEALQEKNPSVVQATDSKSGRSKKSQLSKNIDNDGYEDWSQISQLPSRVATFRNKFIDKWQRKTEVTTGVAAIKSKLHAINQSERRRRHSNYFCWNPFHQLYQAFMLKLLGSICTVLPTLKALVDNETQSDVGAQANGDPELLDDFEFYQQLLKNFLRQLTQHLLDYLEAYVEQTRPDC